MCVLEGLDILEPDINAFAASLDRAHAATFCNATAFYLQYGNEAYRGHLDTDDVLVIHVAGESVRRIRPITRRRTAPSGPTNGFSTVTGPLDTQSGRSRRPRRR